VLSLLLAFALSQTSCVSTRVHPSSEQLLPLREGAPDAVTAVSLAEAQEIEAELGGYFERAPRSAERLIALLTYPEFQQRAAKLHLRHIVVADGGPKCPKRAASAVSAAPAWAPASAW
jgi:hypothetical protein